MPMNVVITGIGAISPQGLGIKNITGKFQSNAKTFRASAGLKKTPFALLPLGLISDPLPPECLQSKLHKFMSRDAELAFAACSDAINDANLPNNYYNPYRTGLFVGSGLANGQMEDIHPVLANSLDKNKRFSLNLLGQQGIKAVNPIQTFKILNNMPLCLISIGFGIKGPNLIFNPWEGQSALAVIEGIEAIKNKQMDCALVGAGDTKTNLLSLIFLQKIGLLSGRKIRPGEGGCFLVLESEARAIKRRARIYARISGWGVSTDAKAGWGYSVQPEPLCSAISKSLMAGAIGPEGISTVYSGYDGNPKGDAIEKAAMEKIFNKAIQMRHPKISLGNLFAASSVLSLGLAAHEIKTSTKKQSIMVNASGIGSVKASFILQSI